MLIIGAGFHKMCVCIANREDPDQTASSVCFDLFGRQLVFKILDQLLYTILLW